jgi:hypothetical protein
MGMCFHIHRLGLCTNHLHFIRCCLTVEAALWLGHGNAFQKYLSACGTHCRRLYVGMMQETRGEAMGMTSLSRRHLKACYVSLSRKTTTKARAGPASPCWVAGGEQERFQIHLLIPAREQDDQALA